jgi:hypothetical protein
MSAGKAAPEPGRVGHQPAIPAGTPSQAQWLRLAEDAVDAGLLRADARRNVLTIARVIGWSASWRTGLSRPTVARLMEKSGLSRRCVQNWLRWIEGQGLLTVTEPGTTPRFRPGILQRKGSSNLAREWRLARPVDLTCTPSGLIFDLSPTRAHARAETGPELAAPAWPAGQKAQRRTEMLEAAGSLRRDHPVLRRMSARAIRSALRPYFAAGWTVADVRHAMELRPDGSQHIHTEPPRFAAQWLAWRLARWLGADGAPARPHSAQLADRAALTRAKAAEDRSRLARRPPADPAPHAARIRAELAARSRQADLCTYTMDVYTSTMDVHGRDPR